MGTGFPEMMAPSEGIVAVIGGTSLETAISPQLQDACQLSLVALTGPPTDRTVITEVLWVPIKSFLPE